MSKDAVIHIEGLSKRYLVGHRRTERKNYTALRDIFARKAKKIVRNVADIARGRQIVLGDEIEEFWALKDVSFELKQGQVLGIVGRNGSGKSTLLKILSRITEPTEGRVRIKGRVASLLEVGTGFHQELTGRENIYLNGAILGMSRAEIRRKFDEIIAFAEVEKFLDTPVKRYSSGMYVRLAFAVAAHLEPEIMVVDEVLAVGDVEFQKKCLGKMHDVAQSGRTVLFVSHNMNAVEELCTAGILLNKGRLVQYNDDISDLLKAYSFEGADFTPYWENDGTQYQKHLFVPHTFGLVDNDGSKLDGSQRNDADMWLQIRGALNTTDPAFSVGYTIYNENGHLLYWSYFTDSEVEMWPKLGLGVCEFRTKIPTRLLNEGQYRIELMASLHCRQWIFKPGEKTPEVHLTIQGGLSDSPFFLAKRPGILAPVLDWNAEVIQPSPANAL